MTTQLETLIIQYRNAQRQLLAAEDADQATFDAALKVCREIRAQINAACPDGSEEPTEFCITQTI